MGAWPTHKAAIIELYLRGLTTRRSPAEATTPKRRSTGYIQGFERVRLPAAKHPEEELPLLTGMTPHVVTQYLAILEEHTNWAVPPIAAAGSAVMPSDVAATFEIARNPEENSRLGYLLRIPIQQSGPVVLKAADTWRRRPRPCTATPPTGRTARSRRGGASAIMPAPGCGHRLGVQIGPGKTGLSSSSPPLAA